MALLPELKILKCNAPFDLRDGGILADAQAPDIRLASRTKRGRHFRRHLEFFRDSHSGDSNNTRTGQ
ncbi:hypothetical protein [Hyphomicrobium sp. LHD-15]|uniref:hypothetical protein n=1 Tax=Hyphomicrobium sp. LHD-15 TaxID=3072142 RepID=UPI00280F0BAB|nr:hypothetical protein [Hyphomicrobium sp. LHD-15]MDQ8698849.1 hypothetical protein [Hyphomicrobium sp. LHD-15]